MIEGRLIMKKHPITAVCRKWGAEVVKSNALHFQTF